MPPPDAVDPADDLGAARVIALRLGPALAARGWRLGTAESCTGGLVGALVTEVPGSSATYLGGVIVYADRLKVALLGVDPEVLAAHGAVSAEVAAQMATGARARLGVDVAVAVTGVAGPGGGSPDKPVGLVHLGLATRDGVTTRRRVFPGDRAAVRAAAARAALAWVIEAAEGTPGTERAEEPGGA